MVGLRAEFDLKGVSLSCVLWAGDDEVMDRFLTLSALLTDRTGCFGNAVKVFVQGSMSRSELKEEGRVSSREFAISCEKCFEGAVASISGGTCIAVRNVSKGLLHRFLEALVLR
jgi:hypothetical protein